MNTPQNIASQTVRAGSNTYFIDARETKAGKPFLVITESRFIKEGDKHERASISIFPEHLEEFINALNAIAGKIGQSK